MLKIFSEIYKKVKNCDIYVAYMGKYTDLIGPPSSMRELHNILSKKNNVMATRNLYFNSKKKNRDLIVKNEIGVPFKKNGLIYNILREIKIFFLLILFNFNINLMLFLNKDIKIIITQPFFIPFLSMNYNVFYVRRANTNVNEISSREYVTRYFESLFLKKTKFKIVYLVKQEFCSYHYYVIPNSFNVKNHIITKGDNVEPNIHVTGTFSSRKGADRIIAISHCAQGKKINVYGGLGSEHELNNKLLNEINIIYHGITKFPYKNYICGDIFLSFSRVEGLQRSLVEALLQGCIIIACSRPDSNSIKDYPGVFVFDWSDENIDAFISSIDKVFSMNSELRYNLGLKNRERAIVDFDEDYILSRWQELLYTKE